ncbi:MAG: DUF86 domain-containing protein [Ignavibacteria bacterium]|jgi:uncharacterized protein YutE (UPF0331/DUF86 family)|nr:DUF86 domain-containing protein [Ignavibacteria bacterium]
MLERLNQLEVNLLELEKFKKKYTLNDLNDELQLQWSLRYGLLESIQIIIDIACHIVSKYNLANPKSYSDCLRILAKEKYLSNSLSERLEGMAGLRNLLVHEYFEIDLIRLLRLLDNLDDLRNFSHEVKEHL